MKERRKDEIAKINGGSWEMALATGWAGIVAGAAAGSVVSGAGTLVGAVAGGIVGVGSGVAFALASSGRDKQRTEYYKAD